MSAMADRIMGKSTPINTDWWSVVLSPRIRYAVDAIMMMILISIYMREWRVLVVYKSILTQNQ